MVRIKQVRIKTSKERSFTKSAEQTDGTIDVERDLKNEYDAFNYILVSIFLQDQSSYIVLFVDG